MRLRFAVPMFAAVAALAAAAAADPLKVCFVSGSFEYSSDEVLAVFERYLERNFEAEVTFLKAKDWDDLPGLEALDTCDVALFYTRRLTLGGEALERIKRYCRSGRPIVAVRTASHGFQNFLEFDREILGGNYKNHFGKGPTQELLVRPGARRHPILDGVGTIRSRESLYRTKPLAEDCEVLLSGRTPEAPAHPAAWTREVNGGRVFYTALGGIGDFEGASFARLVANALFWTARRDPAHKAPPALPPVEKSTGSINLTARTRVETAPGSGQWREQTVPLAWPAAETAIIVCDLWDQHWCPSATERVNRMAPRVHAAVAQARAAGVTIVHAPSETLDFYAGSFARRRAQAAPAAEPPGAPPAGTPVIEPPLPIDDSDGGCADPGAKFYMAWTRQHPAVEIQPWDLVSDDGREIYNYFAQQGIKHVVFMGVHTNMCVLGRSFGIRQMRRWGLDCALVRDLTDAMYDPADPPHVTHDEGTALVVQHIEQYWCPSVLADDLVAGLPAAP